jgi:hypothetical protein
MLGGTRAVLCPRMRMNPSRPDPEKLMTKIGSLALCGTLLLPAAASAQDFGTAGRFAIAAERITSIHHSSSTEEEDDEEPVTTSYTNIALFANPLGGITSRYSFPRIGADYFVTDGLSIGAALGIIHSSNKFETEEGDATVERDGPTISGLLLSPRVGYAFMFEDNIGIWPRAGITYVGMGSETDDGLESSSKLWALSIEVPFVFVPVPHVAFTAAPALDLGLGGSSEIDPSAPNAPTSESDVKATDFGLHLGMLAYF